MTRINSYRDFAKASARRPRCGTFGTPRDMAFSTDVAKVLPP